MNATTCPVWCAGDYIDADGCIVHRHETSADESAYLVRVEQYADAAPGVYVRDANGDDLTPEEALAMARALQHAAALVEAGQR